MAGTSPSAPALPRYKNDRTCLLIGALIVAVLTLAFFGLFWNRFSAIRDANGSMLAAQGLLAGKLPYRDYYSAGPPLHLLKSIALARMFGTDLIVERAFALLERIALALVVYFWLARFFRAPHAALGAALGIIISAGDLADPLVSYNHETILYAVCSGLCASIALGRPKGSWAAGFAGLFAGLALCTKHTIGIGITAGVLAVAVGYFLRSGRLLRSIRFVLCFCAGWLVPIAAIGAWLFEEGILNQALRCMFLRGPSAKGLGAPWERIKLANSSFETLIAVAATLLCLAALTRTAPQGVQKPAARRELIGVFLFALAAIGAGAILASTQRGFYHRLPAATIDFSFLTSGLLASFYALVWVKRKIDEAEAQLWLLAVVSFAVAFMLFLSWPVFEAMVMPGLPFLAALLLDRAGGFRAAGWAVCGILLCVQTVDKLEAPYVFNGWHDQPVALATSSSKLPQLRGLRLAKESVWLTDGVTDLIRKHSRPGETIFTYPAMPIFYYVSGRWWPTYSGSYNIDAVPDGIAENDADLLLRSRPAVLVYYDFAPEFLSWEESLWRNGRRSGQRAVISALETLSREYELAGIFQTPMTERPLKVYVRPEPGAKALRSQTRIGTAKAMP